MTLDKLRLTAFKILKENTRIFLLLALFPFLVGLRTRNGTLGYNRSWLFLTVSAVLIPALYFAILLIAQLFQDAADDKRERAGNTAFSGKVGTSFCFLPASFYS